MLLPNRHSNSGNYRYGFNGQEMDNEIKGEGNSLNFKYRMHDPRVGRFFAVDPLASRYPFMTPYQFASNSPIAMVELEGLEGEDYRFRQWQRAQGGIQAQAAEHESKIATKVAKVVVVDMPEAIIDGVTFLGTTLFKAAVTTPTYAYGDLKYGRGGGNQTAITFDKYGFSWQKGWHSQGYDSGFGYVDPKDGLRLFDGVTAFVGAGEIFSSVGRLIRVGKNLKFKGTVYRYEKPKYIETTWTQHPGNIGANHRYTKEGVGGVYAGTTPETALAEITHYGPLGNRELVSKTVELNKVMDLTDPLVRKKLGVSLDDITHGKDYTIPQSITDIAKKEGYDGILAPSARNKEGSNLIILNE